MKHVKLTAISLLLLAASTSALSQKYSVTNIGGMPALNGGTSSPGMINNSGALVCSVYDSFDPSTLKGFYYSRGSLTDLGNLGGIVTSGLALNDAGQVTGYTTLVNQFDAPPRAYVWANGVMRLLPLPDGAIGSVGACISPRGAVSGFVMYPDSTRAAIFQGNQILELPGLGGTAGSATRVDDHGHAVGIASNAAGFDRAFYWNGSRTVDLGTLGGRSSAAYDFNSLAIVGGAEIHSGNIHPFASNVLRMIDLGVLPQYPDGWATSINHRGEVVGYCQQNGLYTLAFYYYRGRMVSLDSLMGIQDGPSGGLYTYASSINDQGQILAQANGQVVVLTPRR